MDKFTKWGYFIAYKESILVKKLLKIYIKKVFARYKVYINILGDVYSRIRDLSSYINSILFTDRRINKKVKLNTRTVFKALCQSYIE